LRNDGERADFHQRVAQKIEENRGVGGHTAEYDGSVAGRHTGDGGERDQDVAGMGNGAVGEQALDVGLHERAEIAGEHREYRENPESPEPILRG
jgi:hypothetical protein